MDYQGLWNEGFFAQTNPAELLKQFGSPLYIYNEEILRKRAREMAGLVQGVRFQADYSVKANGNLSLLQIIHQEGLHGDAMSPGEMQLLLNAGFAPNEIFFVSNNVSADEMRFAIERDILVSVDSLSQLERFGRLHAGGEVAVRFNPGIGAGHHAKVITAGKHTKFGVHIDDIAQVKELVARYRLKLVGINHHIGSLFMQKTPYVAAMESLLSMAEAFESLRFVDFGGGFGVPYHKQENETRLDLTEVGQRISELLDNWCRGHYGTQRDMLFRIEPGRYVVCECGALLGTVESVKCNDGVRYVGTDIGMNVLIRPTLYDAHHDIDVWQPSETLEKVTVVGNICETGDILAKDRLLPKLTEGDVVIVRDAGAYGYSEASSYNQRIRPAEVLIGQNGVRLIRRRETMADLFATLDV